MGKLKKTEIIILVILWTMSLTTYSIALLDNYVLFPSNYLGLVGLTLVSLVAYFKPEKSFESVVLLLILGLFNLFSFAYFLNFVVTPGIQLISLVFLGVLVVRKREEARELYKETFGRTKEEKVQSKQNSHDRFKRNFEQLSDEEIESKLQQDLVPEAISALTELKEERKNAQQHGV